MLVLKTKEVPNESPENFKRRQNRRHQIGAYVLVLSQHKRRNPNEAKRCVFNDGKVIECLKEV